MIANQYQYNQYNIYQYQDCQQRIIKITKNNMQRVLILDNSYNIMRVIGNYNHTPVTIADVLIGNEAGLAMNDWYNKHVKSDTGWMFNNAYKVRLTTSYYPLTITRRLKI